MRVDGVDSVSGKVSEELGKSGGLALLAAMIAISIYIWVRFEWQFGVGALYALVHDVSLTMGMFALTQMEFDLNIVAAILTLGVAIGALIGWYALAKALELGKGTLHLLTDLDDETALFGLDDEAARHDEAARRMLPAAHIETRATRMNRRSSRLSAPRPCRTARQPCATRSNASSCRSRWLACAPLPRVGSTC